MASIVVSVPLEGPTGEAGADAAEGVLLAVEDAGSPVQVLVEDAGPGPCGRNVPVNAERAAANADVVAYLGEFHSAATEMALPVLEAASLVLDALGRVGEDRAGLTAAMRGTRDRDSVIGRYSFDAHGATTLRSVGRLRVENRRFVPV